MVAMQSPVTMSLAGSSGLGLADAAGFEERFRAIG